MITEEFILKGEFSIMEIFELWFHKFVASSLITYQFEPNEGQKDKNSHPRTQKDANMLSKLFRVLKCKMNQPFIFRWLAFMSSKNIIKS